MGYVPPPDWRTDPEVFDRHMRLMGRVELVQSVALIAGAFGLAVVVALVSLAMAR